jgi:hypothetical protein
MGRVLRAAGVFAKLVYSRGRLTAPRLQRRLLARGPCAIAGSLLGLSAFLGRPFRLYLVFDELRNPRALAGVVAMALLGIAVVYPMAARWRWAMALDAAMAGAPLPRRPHRTFVIVWGLVLAAAAAALAGTLGWLPLAPRTEAALIALRGEDGFWESLGALALFGAGAFFLAASWIRTSPPSPRWMYAVLGVAMLLGGGEEISWGQRLIGFDTPAGLQALNVQQEVNFHNLGGFWANALLLLVFWFYVGALPLLARWFADVRGAAVLLGLPVPPLAFAPLGLAAALLGDHPDLRALWPPSSWRLSEAREVLFSLAMCGIGLWTWLDRRGDARRR